MLLTSALALAGSVACGQSKTPPSNSGRKPDTSNQSQTGDVLAGPKVEDDAQKQDGPMMGPQNGERARRAQPVNFEQWFSALRGLDLGQEKQDKVRSIADEFHQAMREFRQAHSKEVGELESQARAAIQAGKRPPEDVRQKREKLEADRPKPEEYQKRIWDELTDDQQTAMKAKLEEIAAQARKQQMEQRQRRQAAQGKKTDDSMESMDDGQARRGSEADRPKAASGSPNKPGAQEMIGPFNDGKPDSRPSDDPRVRARAERRTGGAALDEIGQRRLRFLRARQSPADPRAGGGANHPSGEPTDAERKFNFADENQGHSDTKP